MENKLLKTKDSLLIGNTKYKEEIYEKARLRTIYLICAQIICLIVYEVLLIVYYNDFVVHIPIIVNMCLLAILTIVQGFSINALIFFKDYILKKFVNFTLVLYILAIIALLGTCLLDENDELGLETYLQIGSLCVIILLFINE